jgi:hypothetical protein
LSRISEVWYCAEENKPIGRSDIVKGYETSKGKYDPGVIGVWLGSNAECSPFYRGNLP